jgi:uncharacterized protein (TIGR03083 family)
MDRRAIEQFVAGSEYFVDVVAAIPPARYSSRWSDEWQVLDLVAHGSRGNSLVTEYLDRPVPPASKEYFTPEAIAARARQAVEDLGEDPLAAVRAASAAAIASARAAAPDATVGAPIATMPLDDYLVSRCAELVLHGLDLARALSLDVAPSTAAVAGCVAFLGARAVQRGKGIDVALALSGRGDLPPGFSVY